MNILITGAAGFIGSHMTERLLAVGHRVRAVDCFTPYYDRTLKAWNADAITAAGAEFHTADLAADTLAPLVAGVDFVFHFAAQPGISSTVDLDAYVRNNITATHRLIEALRRVPTFQGLVNISTSSVYGAEATGDETTEPKPASAYGVTKLAAEQLALSYFRDLRFPVCSARLFSVYGPRERPEKLYPRLIRAVLTGAEFPLYEGSERHLRSYTYVGDIVDGLARIMQRFDRCAGQILNLGLDTAMTTGEGIRIVEDILGTPARLRRLPRRPGDQLRTHANIDKARRLLDYDPQTRPRDGLAQEVAWMLELAAIEAARSAIAG